MAVIIVLRVRVGKCGYQGPFRYQSFPPPSLPSKLLWHHSPLNFVWFLGIQFWEIKGSKCSIYFRDISYSDHPSAPLSDTLTQRSFVCGWPSHLEGFRLRPHFPWSTLAVGMLHPKTWGRSSNVFAPERGPVKGRGSPASGWSISGAPPPESSKQTARRQIRSRLAATYRFQLFTRMKRDPVKGRNIPVSSPLFQLVGC